MKATSLIASLLASLFVAVPAPAQTVDRAALERCAAEPDDERKLACFEALVAAPPPARDDAAPEDGPGDNGTAPAAGARDSGPASLPTLGDDAGQEHLDADRGDAGDDTGPVRATITNVIKNRHGVHYFEMENGQVWRQMEAGYLRYPRDGAFEVEIRRGIMGDYQLRVGGTGRMSRIVRVR